MMQYFEHTCLLAGRILMGIYFIIPAVTKITGFEGTSAYMAAHNVPMIPVLLVLTIFIQLTASVGLIVGYQGKISAFLLAGLTIVISLSMHNFWDYPEGMERAHELQNFFKNTGITAGLLVMAALGTGAFSIDRLNAHR